MSERQFHLKFGGSAAASVDAYLEYKRIVGDDDGGKLFTPEQYEAYKKRVLPMRLENRLYVAWVSPTLMDCKLMGPETVCFCQHRFREHKTDFDKIPGERPIHLPCRAKKCRCASYHYVPLNGSQPIRCRCKHFSDEHGAAEPYDCRSAGCQCSGFSSSFTCGCGAPYHQHHTLVETREERAARGHPVGRDVPYQAMGGLTGFSSLMEGYLRLDPSGLGAPSQEFLNQPITASDNPFLRANVESIKADKMKNRSVKESSQGHLVDEDLAERMSALRRPGESDMDYFERRYQERLKAEKRQARDLPSTDRFSKGKRITGPSTSQATPSSGSHAPSLSINSHQSSRSNQSSSRAPASTNKSHLKTRCPPPSGKSKAPSGSGLQAVGKGVHK
ncbi:protein FAM221A-like isoform X1 [Liolophura sinensis]|uniref:protein FAM221A-like isoform X1 n=1 Tax=Liolophura sinensis TaxID=3198878 RepID=UPI0031594EBF